MRFAIIGAGGVGGYVGGRLAQAGEAVTFVARGPHLAAMQQSGLHVTSTLGDFVVHPVQATGDPTTVGPVDVVVVAVKADQVPDAAALISPLLGPETAVLPLENGIDAAAQLAAVVGRPHVLNGVARILSEIAAPGHIVQLGAVTSFQFGELDNVRTTRVERLQAAFQRAGMQAEIVPDVAVASWIKFVFIASISGVGAVTRATVGELRAIPDVRALLHHAVQEALAVGIATGVALDASVADQTMQLIDHMPAESTASMQRDILAGRPSELETQNGTIVRLGLQYGVPTPIHSFLYAALLPQEHRARTTAGTA